MKVRGLWYISGNTNHIVLETESGDYKKFNLCPYRKITESDLSDIRFFDPEHSNGLEVPERDWRFYGMVHA